MLLEKIIFKKFDLRVRGMCCDRGRKWEGSRGQEMVFFGGRNLGCFVNELVFELGLKFEDMEEVLGYRCCFLWEIILQVFEQEVF